MLYQDAKEQLHRLGFHITTREAKNITHRLNLDHTHIYGIIGTPVESITAQRGVDVSINAHGNLQIDSIYNIFERGIGHAE